MDGKSLADCAAAFGLSLTRTQLEAFALFERRLYEANRAMNLTAVPQSECWRRHFLDSLAISPLIPNKESVLDIGSGPGFPGACLAIARPDLQVSCMDSASKATSFMRDLFSPRGVLPVLFEIIEGRAEEIAHDPSYRERYGVVTGRAVAPFPIQVEVSAAFVSPGGRFVPMRTPTERDRIRSSDVAQFGLRLQALELVRIPALSADRLFPVFMKIGRTPPEFPRKWAQIKAANREAVGE